MWVSNIKASSVLNVLLFVAKNYRFAEILGAECEVDVEHLFRFKMNTFGSIPESVFKFRKSARKAAGIVHKALILFK